MKRIVMLLFLISFVFFLTGCEFFTSTTDKSAYEKWRSSEEALDLNGDQKINEDDYEIYVSEDDYETWRDSEEALDLNGDRKIDEDDYEIYLAQDDYETWKNSDEAIDMNGDRKINEEDFLLFQTEGSYETWRNSEDALDLNGDQKINEDDYLLYKSQDDYESWRNSEDALDFNNDRKIDENDYLIYKNNMMFMGTYFITNFEYIGHADNTFRGRNNMSFYEFGELLMKISINISSTGEITLDIPENVSYAFGETNETILSAAENMTISRISPFIVSIDTSVEFDDITYNLTLYFEEIENGYTTSYLIGFIDDEPLISFDIIKVD